MWKESDEKIVFRTKVKERDKVVISGGGVELYKEIPKAASAATSKSAAAPAAQAVAPTSSEATSADVFTAIEDHVARHPELVANVGNTFVFKLTSPDTAWTLDLKNGKGSVTSGAADKPEVTLELLDSDFLAMTSGKADAMKLYMGGKLKISGNVMASQKLSFLQKIDPKEAAAAIAKKRGGASATASSTAPGAAPGKLTSDQIFFAIGFQIEAHPELVKSVDTIFQWKLTSPDSAWVVDLKNGKGSCKPGTADKADVTLELSDADFLTMAGDAEGAKLAMKLYMGGKLKIGGNVMASQKLTEVLKGIDRESALKAYLAKNGGGAPAASSAPSTAASSAAPAAAATTKEAKSTAFFKALAERLVKNPALAKEVGQVLLFKVKSPDKSYVVDLTGSGAVREGTGDAAMTLTVADEDLLTLTKGADAQRDLYQHGKLRVDGDARLAQKLSFLNQLA